LLNGTVCHQIIHELYQQLDIKHFVTEEVHDKHIGEELVVFGSQFF